MEMERTKRRSKGGIQGKHMEKRSEKDPKRITFHSIVLQEFVGKIKHR